MSHPCAPFLEKVISHTVSAHIPRGRLIKKLGFYGEILLKKQWRFNQEWPPNCTDTVDNS